MRFRETLTNAALILIIASAMLGYVLHLPEVKFEKVNLRLKFQYDYVIETYKPRWLCRGGYRNLSLKSLCSWYPMDKL